MPLLSAKPKPCTVKTVPPSTLAMLGSISTTFSGDTKEKAEYVFIACTPSTINEMLLFPSLCCGLTH
jgi:hypothetical protein